MTIKKTYNLGVRLSERRMSILKKYSDETEKSMTQLVCDWIDSLATTKK